MNPRRQGCPGGINSRSISTEDFGVALEMNSGPLSMRSVLGKPPSMVRASSCSKRFTAVIEINSRGGVRTPRKKSFEAPWLSRLPPENPRVRAIRSIFGEPVNDSAPPAQLQIISRYARKHRQQTGSPLQAFPQSLVAKNTLSN